MILPATKLRALLEERNGLVIPGCHDALGARLIEQAGFPVAYMSGFSVSGTLGLPDVGLMSLADMAQRTGEVARAITLPLLVDADDGFGDAAKTAETVRRLEAAGAVGVHIDDQVLPRPAGASKALIPIEAMAAKITAARDARSSQGFTIIGRTDAMATDGFEAALDRARALEEAGADAVMIMYLTDRAQVAEAARTLRQPLVLVVTETARKGFTAGELSGAGHAAVIYTLSTLLASLAAQRAVLEHLASAGDTEAYIDRMMPMSEVRPLTGLV